MATNLQRQHVKGLCLWLLGKEPQIDYLQRRPMTTASISEQDLVDLFAAGRHIATDCSETSTLICRLAGLEDPNNLGYNGAGFTGTMLANPNMAHYTDPAGANVGALAVFGPAPGNHVATVIGPGADPWLFSHGSQDGPKRVRMSVELAAQKRIHGTDVYTFLNVSKL